MAILYEDYIKDKEKYDIYTPPKKKTTTKTKQNNNSYFKKSKGNTGQAIGYSALDALGNVTEGFLTEPFGMIPYLKDILSIVQGYELDRADVAIFATSPLCVVSPSFSRQCRIP